MVGADTCENHTKSADAAHLFVEQLEQLLAQKSLEKEKEQLDSSVACVAAIPGAKAEVSQVITIDVEIGGAIIPTMVDTGASYLAILFIVSFKR